MNSCILGTSYSTNLPLLFNRKKAARLAAELELKHQQMNLTERECWRLMGFTDDDFVEVLKEYPGKSTYKTLP